MACGGGAVTEELLVLTPGFGVHCARDAARRVAAWGGHVEELAETMGCWRRRKVAEGKAPSSAEGQRCPQRSREVKRGH